MQSRVVIGVAFLLLLAACSPERGPLGMPPPAENQTGEPAAVEPPNAVQNATQNQSSFAGAGEFCGGLTDIRCAAGFYCAVDAVNPNVGGNCVSVGAGIGEACGGIQGIKCAPKLLCKKAGYPDARGTCVENLNYQSDRLYCDRDDDCVRQANCCDCAFGNWVNKEHYNVSLCAPAMPSCKCALRERLPLCQNHQCTSQPIPNG